MDWSRSSTSYIAVITERELHEPMRSFLQQLKRFGYEVQTIRRISYDSTSRLTTPQVVMVDAALRSPKIESVDAAVRATWEYVPIILVARAEDITSITFAPELHDFLTLPTTSQELDARIRFALWKTRGTQAPRDVLEVPGLRMNLSTYEVWVSHRKIELTYKEFELLKHFITNQRRVFTRPELLETVWESDYYGGTRTVDVHIRRLRAKLGPNVGNMIHTVRNVGYRFG